MTEFALLLPHAPDRYEGLTEDEYMAVIADYVAWVEKLTADGIYKGGHKLTDDRGVVVSAADGGIDIHDSPFAEMSEILGGIMIIEAADYAAAVEIVKTHPHLKHNARVEIREIHSV